MGQAQHFFRYASEQVPYAITHYQNETRKSTRPRSTQAQHAYSASALTSTKPDDRLVWGRATPCLLMF